MRTVKMRGKDDIGMRRAERGSDSHIEKKREYRDERVERREKNMEMEKKGEGRREHSEAGK